MPLSTSHLLIGVTVLTGIAMCGLILMVQRRTLPRSRRVPVRDPLGIRKLLVVGGLLTIGLAVVPMLGLGEGELWFAVSNGTDLAEPGAGVHGPNAPSNLPSGTGILRENAASAADEFSGLRRQVTVMEDTLNRLEMDLAAALATRDAYAKRLDDYQQTINQLTAERNLAEQLATATGDQRHDGKATARRSPRPSHTKARNTAEYDDLSRDVAGKLVKVAPRPATPSP